ncbi:glycosyltransferase [Candidatus Woesearchaeota archaeon]|nr:glycosyltransferase [Candidatus Woesearchaeota archaeon]
MKTAIFHNYMDNIGGAEFVDLTLAKAIGADVYTTNIDREKIRKMGFDPGNISSIGRIPVNAPFKQEFAYRRFRRLSLGKRYDFYFIGGDWAMSAGAKHKPNLWYVYSPIREIWDLYRYTRKNNVAVWKRPLFDLWARYHRKMNRLNVRHINKIACISENVRERVKRFLKRDSTVIYPPTDTERYHFKEFGDYWLSVNRLISHKRVEMQIKAFARMPEERLVVVGCYEKSKHFREYASYIKRIKPDNVKILSWIGNNELIELYAKCRGLITTSKDEDYGMTPVEAMASGKPVIAPNEGGYKETVVDNVTGKLIDDIDAEKLVSCVKEVGANAESYKKECLKRAKKFDTKVFIKRMKEEMMS